MKYLFRPTKLRHLHLILSLLAGYLFACASSEKLVFFDKYLNDQTVSNILSFIPLGWFFCCLAYIGLYFYIGHIESKKIEKLMHDKFCKSAFRRVTESIPESKNLIRVSLFAGKNNHLECVGRYQIKKPENVCRIKFQVGEGCVGMAYSMADQVLEKKIAEYNPADPDPYFRQSAKTFKLAEDKVQLLNEKACHFICIPVYSFEEDSPWGILSIDCTKAGILNLDSVKRVEDLASGFSVYLVN